MDYFMDCYLDFNVKLFKDFCMDFSLTPIAIAKWIYIWRWKGAHNLIPESLLKGINVRNPRWDSNT